MGNAQLGTFKCGAITLFDDIIDHRGPERRKERRYPRSIPVSLRAVDPVTGDFGSPFLGVTRDISRSGVGFLSFKNIDTDKVAIALDSDPERMVVGRVCRVNEFNGEGDEKIYLTSVEFLFEREV